MEGKENVKRPRYAGTATVWRRDVHAGHPVRVLWSHSRHLHHLLGSDVAVKAVHCKRFRHFVVARERRGRVNVRLGADELVDLLAFRLPVSRRHG